ncbi:MAG: His/Gly/Thr/Pro-type tRNA ligase C-terminal domain-containing protein, partial [Patescibacteria group bacterium]
IRTEIDKTNETLGKKIRAGKTKKIPYLLVVGEKEEKENTISVNAMNNKEQEILALSQFTEKILKEIADKK